MDPIEYSDLLLPHYVREWRGEVRRATAADVDGIDTEFPVDRIFWLKKHGETEFRLVVRSRCKNCQAINIPCIRDDPCHYCRIRGLRCRYSPFPMPLPKGRLYNRSPRLMLPHGKRMDTFQDSEDMDVDIPANTSNVDTSVKKSGSVR